VTEGETTVEIAEGQHDMLPIGRAFAKPRVPGFHIRNLGTVDIHLEIPVQGCPGRDIRHGEGVARQIAIALQMTVEKPVIGGAPFEPLFDIGRVPLLLRGSVVSPEKIEEIALRRCQAPIEPAVGEGARAGVRIP
jgi:hypothetical protein